MKKEVKNIIIVGVISMVIHLTMIFVNGVWWDDWKFVVTGYSELKQHYISAGRLDAYYIIGIIQNLSIYLFRFIVVLFFAVQAALVYISLAYIYEEHTYPLVIALFYNAIPVNDARLMKCVFPYTFALTLFWMATVLLLYISEVKDKTYRTVIRLLAWLSFFVSFSTNSLLVFYIIPMSFLLYRHLACFKEGHSGLEYAKSRDVIGIIRDLSSYSDFYILPAAFWGLKQILLKPDSSGLYADYNIVKINNTVHGIFKMPKVIISITCQILTNWIVVITRYPFTIFVLLSIFAVCYLTFKRKNKLTDLSIKKNIFGFLIGFVFLIIGLYPYVVIKGGLETTGILGRDSILTCLGFSVMICCVLMTFKIPGWITYSVICCLLYMSFFHFSTWYVDYQLAYYEQVALQQLWLETKDVEQGNTFIYIGKNKGVIDGDSFYTFNAMSKQIYNDSSRFFAKNPESLYYVTQYDKKELFVKDVAYCMEQYDLDHIELSGIMVVTYNIKRKDCFMLWYKEVFENGKFNDEIKKHVNYQYVPVEDDISNQILKTFENGAIVTEDELFRKR